MKNIYLLLFCIIGLFFSVGCSDDKELSDYYPNGGKEKASVATGVLDKNYGTMAVIKNSKVNDGGLAVRQIGFCFSETNNDPKLFPVDPTVSHTALYSDDIDSDSLFVGAITDLDENTSYHYRAYIQNAKGIEYGEVKTLTTGLEPLITAHFNSQWQGAYPVDVLVVPELGFYKVIDMIDTGYNVVIKVDAAGNAVVAAQPVGTHPSYGIITATGNGKLEGKVFTLNIEYTVVLANGSTGSFGKFDEVLTLP